MAAQFGRRLAKGATTTAVAALAVAALSASQAPGVTADDNGRSTATGAEASPDPAAGTGAIRSTAAVSKADFMAILP